MRTYYDSKDAADTTAGWRRLKGGMVLGLLLGLCLAASWSWAQEPGITDKTVRIGATLPLEGDFKIYGQALKRGVEAALAGQSVQGRRFEYAVINDFYNPTKAAEAAKQLIDQGIFVMLGSFGSPTTQAVLPLLAENKVPAVGFSTGAAFTEPGNVLNFRASYAQEVETVVDAALAAGVKPNEVCAYAQNDAYGMSGIKGVRAALAKQSGAEPIVAKLDQILNMPGDNPERNNIGPVGVYQRDTVSAREGYASLKKWEATGDNRCRLVATTAVYDPAAAFMGYARYKGETWIFSTPSPAAGNALQSLLKEQKITDQVIATQIVPPPDSALPVVAEARKALRQDVDYYSLEGYIVGKLFVTIMQAIDGPLTRENFLKAARRQPYDIGGVKVDFTTDNQGSDFVMATSLRDGQFTTLTPQELRALFK
ncbi:MAG: ABC-type branched-chain amino acid transport system, periplasmic component [Proteobacteria bacterium]|nr:ABC-type branched-chain amino acid transport system, periplasmic component [Pseudomonadota bacterium]